MASVPLEQIETFGQNFEQLVSKYVLFIEILAQRVLALRTLRIYPRTGEVEAGGLSSRLAWST
jgi:hypothetical protein